MTGMGGTMCVFGWGKTSLYRYWAQWVMGRGAQCLGFLESVGQAGDWAQSRNSKLFG